jgi:hypothetical protein
VASCATRGTVDRTRIKTNSGRNLRLNLIVHSPSI